MSGGSFNYMYSKFGEEFLNLDYELKTMQSALSTLGCQAASTSTEELILKIAAVKASIQEIDMIADTLRDVWRHVEMHYSGDACFDEKYKG